MQRWIVGVMCWVCAVTAGCKNAGPAGATSSAVATASSPSVGSASAAPTGNPSTRAPGEKGSVGVGFLLLKSPSSRVNEAELAAASKTLGLGAFAKGTEGSDEVMAYRLGDRDVMVTIIPMPHPDAPKMPAGPFSPRSDQIASSKAHAIVAVPKLVGTPVQQDATMARIVAAVAKSMDATAAMLGRGVMFYLADIFVAAAESADPGQPPLEVTVDITVAPEGDRHVSLLTHGLSRYGREELYVKSNRAAIEDAMDFTWAMSRWVVADPDKRFPTGDTVGRSASERLVVQRVPSPADDGSTVVLFDMTRP